MTLLLDKGAKPEMADQAGFTSIILASARGHSRAVDLLLQRGARINVRNEVTESFV